MSVPVDLDPVEVLEHLKALGYQHITKDQLKQFIKDLKKLIKHDLRKLKEQQLSDRENRLDLECRSSAHVKTTGHKDSRKILGERNQAEKPYENRHLKSTAVQTVVPACDTVLMPSVTCEPCPPSSIPSQSDIGTVTCSSCKADRCPCLKPSSKKLKEKGTTRVKPVSSFIRVPPAETRSGKTDPVTLYHYYQSLWARQNRPGENSHADVRWRIRHKMMAPVNVKSCPEIRRENPPWVD